MAERLICCCGASVLTKIIAWANIITYLVVMVPFANAFLTAVYYYVEEGRDADHFFERSGAALFGLILCTVGFAMGILLLVGSHKRVLWLLIAWFIFAFVELIAVIGFFRFAFSADHDCYMGTINGVIQLSCMWVVSEHGKEMVEETVETEGLLPPGEDVNRCTYMSV